MERASRVRYSDVLSRDRTPRPRPSKLAVVISPPRSISNESRQTQPAVRSEGSRTSTACQTCRDKKVKCSGQYPCRYCSLRSINCIFPENQRKRLYSVSRVRELEQRIAQYSRNHRAANPDMLPGNESHRSLDATVPSSQDSCGSLVSPPIGERNPLSRIGSCCDSLEILDPERRDPHETQAISADLTLSSSEMFGNEVRGLRRQSSILQSPLALHKGSNIGGDHYNLVTRDLEDTSSSVEAIWPSEKEAYRLLDLVLFYLGQSQAPFEPRALSDRIAQFYENPSDPTQLKSLWFVEILLVFALGAVMDGQPDGNADLPGVSFYLEALRRVPDLGRLRREEMLGVEVMGLFALYLQSSDSKDDAYIYASAALRLAISYGMCRSRSDRQQLKSQRLHQDRLWWTIYMQERRLAAATGRPVGIEDNAIDTNFPTDAPGFSSSLALNVNIKIARITGQIVSNVYGTKSDSQSEFVSNVQDILSALYDVARTMPSDFELNFYELPLRVTRTSASLHLMLFQAIILTIRPTVLHLAKAKLKGDRSYLGGEVADRLKKLAETCVTAAKRSLDILQALMQQEILAKFSFFDQDATFSVAFIYVLTQSINPGNTASIQGIDQACLILQYFIDNGNRSAGARLTEIHQMCANLSLPPPLVSQQTSSAAEEVTSEQVPDFRVDNAVQSAQYSSSLIPDNETSELTSLNLRSSIAGIEATSTRASLAALEPRLNEFTPPQNQDTLNRGIFDFVNTSGVDSYESIYSVYHDPSLLLTGVDLVDWEAFDRQISESNKDLQRN